MEPTKQATIKRHFLLVALGTIAVLTLLSLTAPFNSGAPAMPGDEAHQSTEKVQACLSCHRNEADAVKPMKHEVRGNCTFCHARP